MLWKSCWFTWKKVKDRKKWEAKNGKKKECENITTPDQMLYDSFTFG